MSRKNFNLHAPNFSDKSALSERYLENRVKFALETATKLRITLQRHYRNRIFPPKAHAESVLYYTNVMTVPFCPSEPSKKSCLV